MVREPRGARTATGRGTRSSTRPTTSRRRSPTSPATASRSWSASPRGNTATPRPTGRTRRSRGRSTPSPRTTSTATSRTAWASATSTATGGSTCSRRTAGGNSPPRSPAIRSGRFHAQPLGAGGAQMYAYDVNGDGLNDVITASTRTTTAWPGSSSSATAARSPSASTSSWTRTPKDNTYGVKFSEAPRHRSRRHGRRRPQGHRHRQALLVARPHRRPRSQRRRGALLVQARRAAPTRASTSCRT